MPRLRILNATEREAYDKPPVFNAAARRRAFDLPASLLELAGTVEDPVQQIGLLVSAAYLHAMISRRHVNMLGEYDFSDERLRDSFGLRPRNPAA